MKYFFLSSSLGPTKFLVYSISLMRSPYITAFFVTFDELKLGNSMEGFYNYARMYDSYKLNRFQLSSLFFHRGVLSLTSHAMKVLLYQQNHLLK